MDKYDPDYFIKLFEAIPEELWTKGKLQITNRLGVVQQCALGFLGVKDIFTKNPQASALDKILQPVTDQDTIFHIIGLLCPNIAAINDAATASAKQNILCALKKAKVLAKGRF